MVFSVGSETETPPIRMSTGKPHPLHNFGVPVLRWGNQRLLRCMKVDPNGNPPDRRSPPSDAESADRSSPNRSGSFRKPSTPSPPKKLPNQLQPADSDSGIEEIRAKLLDHLRTAAYQMRYKIPEEREEEESSALRPWNLRTRRAACKAPGAALVPPPPPPVTVAENSTRSRLRGSTAASAQVGEKKEKKKLSVSLSREEVEQDFLAITGSKPSRRPKKRARIVQRQLEGIFPGLWLAEITPECYKVSDFPEPGKR